jgi:hypothetical protein
VGRIYPRHGRRVVRSLRKMPRFRIQIEGSNIVLPRDDAQTRPEMIRGFFVSRVVNAPTAEAAAARASAVIASDWSRGQFSHLKLRPTLSVAEVRPAGLWEWLRAKNTGYVFHPGN